jgi:3-deoxy-D-manno-octulosonic-acid transferase
LSGFALWLHSAAQRLALPLNVLRLLRSTWRDPSARAHWAERLGYGVAADAAGGPGALWIHAPTRAEVHTAAAVIDALRGVEPGLRLLLTHATGGAREAGRRLLRDGDAQSWLPVDTPGAVRRFLHRWQPLAGLMMRSGVRPNLFAAAARRRLPLIVADARLSESQLAAAGRWRSLTEPAMSSLTLVLAQTEADAWRLGRSGARQVRVTGSLSLDLTPSPRQLARGLQWRGALGRAVVLAVHWHEAEEIPLLRAWLGLPEPRPLLLLVPADARRCDEVAELVLDFRLLLRRRSGFGDEPPPDAAEADVWLGDVAAEVALYFGLADAALLGGSFVPQRQASAVEAAACGCPLVIGPHAQSHDAIEVLSAGAALRAVDLEDAVARAAALAIDPARNDWVEAAFAFSALHRGAAKRVVAELLAVLARVPR